MEKNEVLEKLQKSARELASLEKWLQHNGENRLAEYVCVRRLINFKVQELVDKMQQSELDKAIYALYADLLVGIDNARDCQAVSLQEYYGVAMDYLSNLRGILLGYLP